MSAVAKVRAGIRYTLAGTVLSAVVQFGVMLVLARLLPPVDYGVYAIAMATAAMTTGFALNCFDRAAFLMPDAATRCRENLLTPLFVGGLALVVLLASGVFALTGVAVPLVPIALACATSTINALLLHTKVCMRRNYRFGPLVAFELTAQLLGAALLSIVLALSGLGASAILVGQLAAAVLHAGLCLRLNRQNTTFTLNPADFAKSLKGAIGMGRSIALEVVNGQIPTAIVASLLGPVALGLFNRATTLIQLPVQLLSASVNRVAISALRDATSDRTRLAVSMARLVRLTCAMISPILGGMIGSADRFATVILGPNFAASAALVPPLALAAWSAMLGVLFANLAEAAAAIRLKIVVQAASSTILVVAILAGASQSLPLAAFGMAFGAACFHLLYIAATTRLIRVAFITVLRWHLPGLGAGMACCAAAMAVAHLPLGSDRATLAAQCLACALVTAAYYLAFFPDIAREALVMAQREPTP